MYKRPGTKCQAYVIWERQEVKCLGMNKSEIKIQKILLKNHHFFMTTVKRISSESIPIPL